MALVKKSDRRVTEMHQSETERQYRGKPIFRTIVEFINCKPKHNFDDGPNAYVQMCVENRVSTQDWFMSIDDLRDIADACNEAIAQLQPYTKPSLNEVK